MATATLIGEDIGGFVGPANLYSLDPPMVGQGGVLHDYVVVWLQAPMAIPSPSNPGMQVPLTMAEVAIVGATAHGAATSMTRLPGSYTHPEPSREWALLMAGGYEVSIPDPETGTEPAAPEGEPAEGEDESGTE